MAAGYLAKYVSKNIADEERLFGLHRYEVGQGFQPERVQLAAEAEDQVVALACDQMGGRGSSP